MVLTPQNRLVLGGPAEEYERRVQAVFSAGSRQLVTDLGLVPQMDSTGVRAIVRGYTTSQRIGARYLLANAQPLVRMVLQITHLDSVLEVYASVEAAMEGARSARKAG